MTALADFEDREVVRATIRVTGAGDGLSQAMEVNPTELHVGDNVVLVMKTTVKRVAYEPRPATKNDPNPDGELMRVHFLGASATTIVEEKQVAKILAAHAANLKAARDAIAGQMAFDEQADLEAAEAAAERAEAGE